MDPETSGSRYDHRHRRRFWSPNRGSSGRWQPWPSTWWETWPVSPSPPPTISRSSAP